MATYSLGSFDFLRLNSFAGYDGAPMLPRTHCEMVQRLNVKGTGFVIGQRTGMLFPMQSFIDLANDAQAALLIANYHLAVNTDPLTIVWRDINYFSLYGVKYMVVDVTDIRSCRLYSATGGLNPPSLSCLSAIWHLMPVEVER